MDKTNNAGDTVTRYMRPARQDDENGSLTCVKVNEGVKISL